MSTPAPETPLPPLVTAQQVANGSRGKILEGDPRLAPLIDGASASIRRYCGWHITPVITQTITLDGPGGDLLALPTLRLVEILSIAEHGTPLTEQDYDWSEIGSILRRRGCWSPRYRAIVTEVRHGFESAPDVAQIVQQVVLNALASPLGATAETAGGVSVTWAQTAPGVAGGMALLQRDLDVLNLYRLASA